MKPALDASYCVDFFTLPLDVSVEQCIKVLPLWHGPVHMIRKSNQQYQDCEIALIGGIQQTPPPIGRVQSGDGGGRSRSHVGLVFVLSLTFGIGQVLALVRRQVFRSVVQVPLKVVVHAPAIRPHRFPCLAHGRCRCGPRSTRQQQHESWN